MNLIVTKSLYVNQESMVKNAILLKIINILILLTISQSIYSQNIGKPEINTFTFSAHPDLSLDVWSIAQNSRGIMYFACTTLLDYDGKTWRRHVNELTIYKADRQPIGIYLKEIPFTNHKIQLQKNDVLYTFSDGFVDQIGGKSNRKFMSKQFKELLQQIQTNELNEQKQILEQTFANWQKNAEQMDDVLIIGVKI